MGGGGKFRHGYGKRKHGWENNFRELIKVEVTVNHNLEASTTALGTAGVGAGGQYGCDLSQGQDNEWYAPLQKILPYGSFRPVGFTIWNRVNDVQYLWEETVQEDEVVAGNPVFSDGTERVRFYAPKYGGNYNSTTSVLALAAVETQPHVKYTKVGRWVRTHQYHVPNYTKQDRWFQDKALLAKPAQTGYPVVGVFNKFYPEIATPTLGEYVTQPGNPMLNSRTVVFVDNMKLPEFTASDLSGAVNYHIETKCFIYFESIGLANRNTVPTSGLSWRDDFTLQAQLASDSVNIYTAIKDLALSNDCACESCYICYLKDMPDPPVKVTTDVELIHENNVPKEKLNDSDLIKVMSDLL